MARFGLPLAIALLLAASILHAEMPDDITVSIRRDGDTFAVTVELAVDAPPEDVFAVLTDYGNMARFVSNVAESRIVRRDGDTVVVEQKSRLVFGPLHFDFVNLRVVEPVPFNEIRAWVTEGDMQGSSFVTKLTKRETGTWIENRGSFVVGRWIPPIIGSAVLKSETRKQFQEYRKEILRRRGIASPLRK